MFSAMTFRRNLLKQVYQDSNMSNITVDSEMFISTPFDHHHHLAEFHPPHHHHHAHSHSHHPQLLKCPAAATSQRNNNKGMFNMRFHWLCFLWIRKVYTWSNLNFDCSS